MIPARPENHGRLAPGAAILVIVATAFLYNRWLLDPRTFFRSDDWQWLWLAEHRPWSGYFEILPSAAYNDRPVGAAAIKLLYALFGLNHLAFQSALLILHATNCVLLYLFAARYTARGGALLAALLAAIWFSANAALDWTAAIFDVLGATLCLATLYLHQLSIRSGNSIGYNVAGVACYALAIRTKEFALGTVALLFLMHVFVERQSIRATIKHLAPSLVVFAIYAVRYAQLVATAPPPVGDPYHLDFSIQSVLATLGYYFGHLFYGDTRLGSGFAVLVVAGLGAGMMGSDAHARRIALFGVAAFVIMLGPVLLIPAHPETLYLYAPHFFLAVAIGALFTGRRIPMILGIAVALAVVIPATSTHSRQGTIDYYFDKGETSQAQFNAAVGLLSPLPSGTAIFIAGVEPFFNPFSSGPGLSLKTAFRDATVTVYVEKPYEELVARFCQTTGPRRFLSFAAKQGSDVTREMEDGCRGEVRD